MMDSTTDGEQVQAARRSAAPRRAAWRARLRTVFALALGRVRRRG